MKLLAVIGAALLLFIGGIIGWGIAQADHRTPEFYESLDDTSLGLPYQRVTHAWGNGTAIVIKHDETAAGCVNTYLTAWHVVKFDYFDEEGEKVEEWQEELQIAGVTAEPLRKAPQWDMALMTTLTPECIGFPIARYPEDLPLPRHLSKIIIAGYPLGMGPYAADGRIMTWDETKVHPIKEPLLVVGAVGGGGMSGGPVFYEGYMIGMTVSGAPTKAIGYILWAIPAWLIEEFLNITELSDHT